MMDKKEKLNELKRRHNAVILAHYYAPADVQEAADYIGDSFLLSQTAARLDNPVICFAGVRFMGESAKILCPDKTVLLPEAGADCPMAHMADPEEIAALRERVEDLAVVCYINSTAELKCCADVCVTSSNALKIVRSLPNKNICFIPDRHLGQHIAASLPEKRFFFFDGCCHVHTGITPEQVRAVRKAHPGIPVLAHPECRPEVLELADYLRHHRPRIILQRRRTADLHGTGRSPGAAEKLSRKDLLFSRRELRLSGHEADHAG